MLELDLLFLGLEIIQINNNKKSKKNSLNSKLKMKKKRVNKKIDSKKVNLVFVI